MRTVIILLLCFLLSGAAPSDVRQELDSIKIHTVAMPPFVYDEFERDDGALLSLTKMAFQLANVPYDIQYQTAWDEAVDEVNLRRNTVFVGDVTNRNREFFYKTTNTQIPIHTVMYANTDNLIVVNRNNGDFDGLRVGVVADRLTGNDKFDRNYLTKPDYYKKFIDADHLLTALVLGTIDVAVLPREVAEYRIAKNRTLSRYEDKIMEVGMINKSFLHILWNKKTSDETVAAVEKGFEYARKFVELRGMQYAIGELQRLESIGELK